MTGWPLAKSVGCLLFLSEDRVVWAGCGVTAAATAGR